MTENPIIKDKYPVQGKDKTIYIAKAELISHGCKNCIWKLHDQCPHGHVDNGFEEEGICAEFLNFLLSLSEGSDSVTAIWEKFNLYVMRLESLSDYNDFMRLKKEIKLLEAEGNANPGKLADLEAKHNSYKLWWLKLNEVVLKGLRGIVDREKKDNPNVKPKMTVQQLNILINASAKELAALEDKSGNTK